MKSRITVLLCLTCLMIYATLRPTPTTAANLPPENNILANKEPAADIHLTLHTTNLTIDANGQVTADGLDQTLNIAGAPILPYYTTYIALPPNATPKIDLTTSPPRLYSQATVASTPQEHAQTPEGDFLSLADLTHIPYQDKAIYANDALYPTTLYTLSDPLYQRDQRLVQLTLYPIRYNPVTQQLQHIENIDVHINFVGTNTEISKMQTAANTATTHSPILNADQASTWRGFPQNLVAPTTPLPLNTPTFKIAVDQDAIYELTYTDLQAAGMDVDNVNPHTFAMQYRGAPVSYQFLGDTDTLFEAGEAIRFYGWAFNGSRIEKQHVTDNTFWLWADGTPSLVSSQPTTTTYPLQTSFPQSITAEPENYWFGSWHDDWEDFPNEPDAYYWDYFNLSSSDPVTRAYNIDLFDPAPTGPDTTLTAEFSGRTYSNRDTAIAKSAQHSGPLTRWRYRDNTNITATIPITTLADGSNEFLIIHDNFNLLPDQFYLNRITVDYHRQTIARNNHLIITDNGGQRDYQVSNFTDNNAHVWHVTDPHHPAIITPQISGTGTYTVHFGSDDPTNTPDAFIVMAETAVLSPLAITPYTPTNITPVAGADWVAISHNTLITTLQTLTSHRQQALHGGLSTYVVDVNDILNQYGGGLPIPTAIDAYLLDALTTWSTPPRYAVLVGDASTNPRQITLTNMGSTDQEMVPTHLSFVDRFQGQVPSDPQFSFLIGDDFLPDISVARLPAQTPTELAAMIDKIILYETNLLTPEAWMQDFLFMADNKDSGGNFCKENKDTAKLVDDSFNNTFLCMPSNNITDTETIRDQMYETINMTGTLLLNYRGHGSIDRWTATPYLNRSTFTNLWNNPDRPTVILSADCLDGYFTHPTRNGLGEAFLGIDGAGTAAHWSSSGLGYSVEHTYLHEGFYQGLFDDGVTVLGDTIDYAKVYYLNLGYGHVSEVQTFTLLGDPAMRLMRPDLSLTKETNSLDITPGNPVTFTLTLQNNGLYPTYATVTDTLPNGITPTTITATHPFTTAVFGNQLTITLTQSLSWQETATITITAATAPTITAPFLTNNAIATSTDTEIDTADQNDFATIPFAGCTAQAPATPTAAIQTNNALNTLNWSSDPNNASFTLNTATTPYPLSWTLLTTLPQNQTQYQDTASNQNQFYQLIANNCDSSQTAVSQTVGRFHFNLEAP